jgi:hypothetical protein
MANEILITAAISVATVVVSATQILVAHLSKSKEMEIARLDQERKWKLSMSEFLLAHMGDIFSANVETRAYARRP